MLIKTNQMKTLTPNNSGKKYLTEQCHKIKISDYLKQVKNNLKELLISSQLESEGLNIELITSRTNYSGLRFWFKCHRCERRVGILYKHPLSQKIGCRRCLNLKYRSRRYKGMIENKKFG